MKTYKFLECCKMDKKARKLEDDGYCVYKFIRSIGNNTYYIIEAYK